MKSLKRCVIALTFAALLSGAPAATTAFMVGTSSTGGAPAGASNAPAVLSVPASSPAPAVAPVPASSPAPAVAPVPASSPAPAVAPAPASLPAPAVAPVPASSPAPAVASVLASSSAPGTSTVSASPSPAAPHVDDRSTTGALAPESTTSNSTSAQHTTTNSTATASADIGTTQAAEPKPDHHANSGSPAANSKPAPSYAQSDPQQSAASASNTKLVIGSVVVGSVALAGAVGGFAVYKYKYRGGHSL